MHNLDPNMLVPKLEADYSWYDGSALTIEGKGWQETEKIYSRLPIKAKGVVRDEVWKLGLSSAGISLHFTTDAKSLAVRWDGFNAMNHMPATGVSGLDLYVKNQGRWRWLSVGRPSQAQNETLLFKDFDGEVREYILYLPLYNSIKAVGLGVNHGAFLRPTSPRKKSAVAFYGTSVTQGGCASRTGMSYPAIIGRKLDRPVLNLGFSGNGRMEPEVIDLLCELDPSLYVLDCLPNLEEPFITERLEPALLKLRKARPNTPILLVDNILYCDAFLVKHRMDRVLLSNKIQKEVFDKLKKNGFPHLYHILNDNLIGDDGEATVDGVHLTDLGYTRISEELLSVIYEILPD